MNRADRKIISPVFYFLRKLATIKNRETESYNGGMNHGRTSKADSIRYGWNII